MFRLYPQRDVACFPRDFAHIVTALLAHIYRQFYTHKTVFLYHCFSEQRMIRPRPRWKICNTWLRKLWVLVSVDRLFWPLIVTAVYMPIGKLELNHKVNWMDSRLIGLGCLWK